MSEPKLCNCIVTGGAGFIGSHLVERLLADGHKVTVIDNYVTGRRDNLAREKDNPRLIMVEADVCDQAKIEPFFENVNLVFHLAAMADIVPSIQSPAAYHHANVNGTVTILECVRNANCERLIYTGSSSCYGLPDVKPTPEHAPARPMYPYALTKWIGEQYAMHWAQTYQCSVISLRLFNVFGPRHRTGGTYGAMFGVFLAQKLANKPFTIVGDGTQTRDFTFVSDVVDAFVTAAKSDITGKIMNVGSGGTYSVNRIAELLGGETVNIPKRPGEPDCTFADITQIEELLGWRPKVSLEEGVQVLLDQIDDWRDAPVWEPPSIKEATADWFKYLGNKNA